MLTSYCFIGKEINLRPIIIFEHRSSRYEGYLDKCSFLFPHENIGYSLEVHPQNASNEHHNIYFCEEIRKILIHVFFS